MGFGFAGQLKRSGPVPPALQPTMESPGGGFAAHCRTVLCVYIINSAGRAALPPLLPCSPGRRTAALAEPGCARHPAGPRPGALGGLQERGRAWEKGMQREREAKGGSAWWVFAGGKVAKGVPGSAMPPNVSGSRG